MNILLLRGKEPTDRDPSETYYKSLADCDDIYTLILAKMVENTDYKAQIWYWGGKRIKQYNNNVKEVRVSSFSRETIHFMPDIIIARGGFAEYDVVMERYPHAFKIYYGAHAERFYPEGFCDYNVILVDSPEQKQICEQMFPNIHCEYLLKPAADNIIYAIEGNTKEYDICFPANGKQMKFKGHEFVYITSPSQFKILNLGNPCKLHKPPHITQKRVLRKNIAKEYAKCKVGIICCNKGLDSCPRVLPEMLACNIPVICTDTFYFWKEKYINRYTGVICKKEKLWETVKDVLANMDKFKPAEYYQKHLSIEKAAEHIWQIIKKYKAI